MVLVKMLMEIASPDERSIGDDDGDDSPLREGEIITNVITNDLSSRGGQSPSTSSPAPSPLKTLVHLLYPILYQNHELVPVGC